MPGWARKTDKHNLNKPIESMTAETVIINGLPAAMINSKFTDGSMVVQGSSSVFVEGKPAAFLNGKVSNGNNISSGSSDVIIGV